MITFVDFRRLALALPGTTEAPHFDRTSFRVGGKIYATAPRGGDDANLMLDVALQAAASNDYPGALAPVPGGWGAKGATTMRFDAIDEAGAADLLDRAWRRRAPGRLRQQRPR